MKPTCPGDLRLANSTRTGERFPLSQRERAGVREDGAISACIRFAFARGNLRRILFSAASAFLIGVLGLAIEPSRATAQAVSPWPPGTPLPFVQGPTLTDTVRNAVQATSDQTRLTIQTATDMGRKVRGVAYQMQNFSTDYQNLQFQFQGLRSTFNLLGELALQLQSARAANAAAELDAGLNIIAEAFAPVQQELQMGVVSRDTVVRMCEILKAALLEWQKELKKSSSRLGTIR